MIISADNHYTPYIWASRPEVYGDAFTGMEYMEQYVTVHRHTEVVLAGDIFNSPFPDADSLYRFSRFCKVVHDHGGTIYAVQGNHDKSTVPLFKAFDVIPLSKEPRLTKSGQKVCGLDWMPTQQLQQALSEVPECDLLVMHSPFRHMLGFDGKWQLEMKDIPEHIRNVVSGDIHKFNLTEMSPGRMFISPGTTRLNNLSELREPKGFVTCSDMKDFKHVPYEPRIFRFADTPEQAQEQVEKIRLMDKLPLTPVLFVPEKVHKLYAEVKDIIVLAYNQQAAQQKKEELQADSGREISLLGFLPEVIDKEKEPELYSFVEGALSVHSDGLGKYLEDWLKTRGL
jgi:DNA repair exonuclease SbcCD nuclease subunit